MMGGNSLPSVLMPAAFAPLFCGGGGRCASRICRHLHRRRVERLWREKSSSKKAKLMEIRHSLIECLIAMMVGLSLRPCALWPTAFALVLPGGGSRCARRICCHLLGEPNAGVEDASIPPERTW